MIFTIKNGQTWVAYWVEGVDACSCISCARQVQWWVGSNGCDGLVQLRHVALNLCKFSLMALYSGTGDQVVSFEADPVGTFVFLYTRVATASEWCANLFHD